jgi:glycosyltransferase involved in cell wall biosynthesis
MNQSKVKEKILFVGSYLEKKRGTLSIAEKLANKFQKDESYNIKLISRKYNKFARILDIFFCLILTKYTRIFIDTYSGNSFYLSILAAKILRIKNKKYSLVIRGGNFINFYEKNEKWIHKELLLADSLISPSQFIIEFLKTKGINVDYLPNYIDRSNFPANVSVERTKFSLLWVRAFTEIYNPLIPIKIIQELKHKYPKISLTMVGPDLGTLNKIRTEISNLKLEDFVTIVGSIPNSDLYKFYQSHSIYLNTTSFESFGMALLEAASCGIPIVSSNVGEIPYIYKNGKSILLVDDFSIKQYVNHIESIFESESLWKELSLNGISVSQKYIYEEIKPSWIKQFQRFEGEYLINNEKSGILFVGTFLSRKRGTKGPSETVARNLKYLGYKTKITSFKNNKLLRKLDIFFAILLSGERIIHIDVFSGPSFLIAKYTTIIANHLGKKIILNLHGGRLPEYFYTNKIECTKVFYKVNRILTPSKYLQSFFSENGFEIYYLPNSIDVNKFPFKLTTNLNKILWVRAFTKIYQPKLAIDILEIVKTVYPKTTLTMIGPDLGLRSEIDNYIKSKKLNNSIEILGSIDNNLLSNYFHEHSVYINTTQYESFGVAVLESASSGLPVVSTHVGEIPFLWKNEEDILIDSSCSAKGMAECVIKLFEDENIRLKISRNAKIKSELFSWEKIKPLWEDILIKFN